jgi:activator of 2-hydroxyglutaryl-CoA dehydratase
MMTGGVARNRGVVAAIEERLQGKLLIPEEPEICGALGAALVALESGTDG